MQQRLACRGVAAVDHLAHLGLEQRQVVVGERLTLLGFLGGQLLAAGFRAAQPLGQLTDPGESLDRYFRAFEEGTMPESACAPRNKPIVGG